MENEIQILNREYLWTETEERINVGDVFAFNIKERKQKMFSDGEFMEQTVMMQPILTQAILLRIFDNERIQILDDAGNLAIIDREYFSDFIRVYDKNSQNGLAFYTNVVHEILKSKSGIGDFGLKHSLMTGASDAFRETMIQKEKPKRRKK